MPIDQVQAVVPMGVMVAGHVTPVDHLYYSPMDFNDPDPLKHDVIADADGYVVAIEFQGAPAGQPPLPDSNRFRLTIEHSCLFYSIYNLMTQLDPVIASQFVGGKLQGRIKITSGEHLGKVGHRTLDYQIADADVVLSGFVNPSDYLAESWKIHTVGPLNYSSPELQHEVLPLYQRQAQPRDGRIDYDRDGHLIGNWFKQGFPGYGGFQAGGEKYYANHLAFAPDYLDPADFHVSIGNWLPDARQFSVKGNLDPASITPETGLVKWELVDWTYTLGRGGPTWDRMSVKTDITAQNVDQSPEGTVLVQMLDMRTVKFESFPGVTPDRVSGFDDKAWIYTR